MFNDSICIFAVVSYYCIYTNINFIKNIVSAIGGSRYKIVNNSNYITNTI